MRLVFPGRAWICLLLACGMACPLKAQEADSGEKLYQRILKSTAWIVLIQDDQITATGTGSLIDRTRRLVITNYHIVNDHDRVNVLFPVFKQGKVIPERNFYLERVRQNGSIPGKVVARNPKTDLALIQLDMVPDGVQELRLARDGVRTAQRVHSVGNPGRSGALWVYTKGEVRQVYHKVWKATDGNRLYSFDAQVVETQAPTNAGDSGGPLVNDRGELVGVTQGTAKDAQLLSIAIDVSEVKALLKSRGLPAKLAAPTTTRTPRATVPSEDEFKARQDHDEKRLEQTAAQKLLFARLLAEEGKVDKARERCHAILKEFPNTAAAREAEQLLKKLDKDKE